MITGTLINYYHHCKRQCWLHANRINLEDNSEDVRIGKILHEIKAGESAKSEIKIANIVIDKITKDYLVEMKKSDADKEAVRWQILLYLKTLKDIGINKKGKIEYLENNKGKNKIEYVELSKELESELEKVLQQIEVLTAQSQPPKEVLISTCKKCAYYEYCFI